MNRKKKVILSLISLSLVMVLLSLTIGQDMIAGRQASLSSFTILNFAGYLFFLLLPVETLIPYYQSLGHNAFLLIIIAVGTAMLAQPINYAIGFLMSSEIIKGLLGEKKHDKIERYIQEYGRITIFCFNFFPLASPVLSVVAGMVQFRFRTLMIYSLLGLTGKYIVIVLLFKWLV